MIVKYRKDTIYSIYSLHILLCIRIISQLQTTAAWILETTGSTGSPPHPILGILKSYMDKVS